MVEKTTNFEQERIIVKMYLEGLSMEKIKDTIGIGVSVTKRVLRDWRISPRSCGGVRPYNINSKTFDDLSLEESAYWFGFLFADAGINRSNIYIALARKDKAHLYKFAKFMGCETRFKLGYSGKYPTASLGFSDRPLMDKLREMGLEPHRPNGTRVFLYIPDISLNHFLRGWFDGDGCIYTKPQIAFVGNVDFLNVVQEIFISQGIAKKVTIKAVRKTEKREWGNLVYRGRKRCLGITNYLYKDATIWLSRKRDRIKIWENKPGHQKPPDKTNTRPIVENKIMNISSQ